MSTEAPLPALALIGWFEQSRIVTDWIVTVPVPLAAVLDSRSVNSVPVCSVGPQSLPSVTPSIV
jgi:hypothetical protein